MLKSFLPLLSGLCLQLLLHGVVGCVRVGSSPPKLQKLARGICEKAAASQAPTVLAPSGKFMPTFNHELLLVAYNGCSVEVRSECQAHGSYSRQDMPPQLSATLKRVYDKNGLAVNAPQLLSTLGAGLTTAEGVGIEVLSVQRVQSNVDAVTSDMVPPPCRAPGYVTHFVRMADLGAYIAVRDNARRLQASLGVLGFGAATAQHSYASRIEAAGAITACASRHPDCSAPVRYHLGRIEPNGHSPSQISPQPACANGQMPLGGSCAPDMAAVLSRATWLVQARIAAPGCSDGVGGCEIGYDLVVRGRQLMSGRGPQDQGYAGPFWLPPVSSLDLQSGLFLRATELDAFENDWLGECHVAFSEGQLYLSATQRIPIQMKRTCGNVEVHLRGDVR